MKNIVIKCISLIFVVILFTGVYAGRAQAWCWIRDTGRTGTNCSGSLVQQDCCSGNPRIWSGATMTYDISTSTAASNYTDIRAGFATWTNVAMANFTFVDGGTTTAWDAVTDGINIINIDASFCTHYPFYCGMGILGFSGCGSTGSGASYRASECDIILNGEEYTWGDGTGGTYDTVAVVVHEAGHDAGVTHPGSTCRSGGSCGCGPEFSAATMYYSYSGGQPTTKSSLELDDVASLVYGYPRSTFRVRVINGGAAVSGATVSLIGTSAPVNGTSIATGGSVRGDISAPYLFGDKTSSSTYSSSTPFNLTDVSGYTNYISPVHQSFSVQATQGSLTLTQAFSLPAGISTLVLYNDMNSGGDGYTNLGANANATTLERSASGTGYIDYATDEYDQYKVPVGSGEQVQITFTPPSGATGIDLWVYQPDMATGGEVAANITTTHIETVTVSGDGYIYCTIDADFGDIGTYSLEVTVLQNDMNSGGDAYTGLSASASATTLGQSVSGTGYIDKATDEYDQYKVPVSSGEQVQITFTPPSGATTIDLYVYQPDMTTGGEVASNITTTHIETVTASGDGYIYFTIDADPGDIGPYSLGVSVSSNSYLLWTR